MTVSMHTCVHRYTHTQLDEFRTETERVSFWSVSPSREGSLLSGFHFSVSWKHPRNGGDMQGEDF